MAFVAPYADAPKLLVRDDDNDFYEATVACLDQIRALPGVADMPNGENFIKEIGTTEHTIKILSTDGGNKCKSSETGRFVRLRDAFQQVADRSIAEELTHSFKEAGKQGMSMQHVARQLMMGLSPVTIHTDKNVAKGQAWQNNPSAEGRIGAHLIALKDGTTTECSKEMQNGLVRLLRNYLRPGGGARAGLFFNAYKTVACELDAKGTARPPAIGLVHELVHAWRNVAGLRLFDDAQACGMDDDEVMTTGFPPYTYEKYTENKFRLAWHVGGGEKLDIRTDYRTYAAEKAAAKL